MREVASLIKDSLSGTGQILDIKVLGHKFGDENMPCWLPSSFWKRSLSLQFLLKHVSELLQNCQTFFLKMFGSTVKEVLLYESLHCWFFFFLQKAMLQKSAAQLLEVQKGLKGLWRSQRMPVLIDIHWLVSKSQQWTDSQIVAGIWRAFISNLYVICSISKAPKKCPFYFFLKWPGLKLEIPLLSSCTNFAQIMKKNWVYPNK